MKKHSRIILSAVAVFLLVLLDQLTKKAAVMYLKGKDAFSLIPGVFELQYLENRGAAFGALQNRRWFFILVVFMVLSAPSRRKTLSSTCHLICPDRRRSNRKYDRPYFKWICD